MPLQPAITPATWQARGFTETPPMRTQILELTIDELSENGIERFRPENVCERLHITRSLINHHFGNRDKLVSEAMTIAYERYVQVLRAAALAADTPMARLEAWMLAQVKWTRQNRGLAALIQLPHPDLAKLQRSMFAAELEHTFKLNMNVLAELIRGAQTGTTSSLEFEDVDAEFARMFTDLSFFMLVASVGLSALGTSIWAAGANMPATGISEYFLNDIVLMQHLRWVAASAAARVTSGEALNTAFDPEALAQVTAMFRTVSADTAVKP